MIKAKLLPGKEQAKANYSDLLDFVDFYIKEIESGKILSDRGTPIQPNTIKIYKTLKKNLAEFKTDRRYDLHFENIGLAFFEDLKEYLTLEKKYATNTLAKHIRVIKTLLVRHMKGGLLKYFLPANAIKLKQRKYKRFTLIKLN